MQKILDVCCGSRMFWFNKKNPLAIFMDKRVEYEELSSGHIIQVQPDIQGDFRSIPFPDNTFYHVVFDPPHLLRAGQQSWLRKKYGVLEETWKEDLTQGFQECLRVLKPNGTLVFKWNECQVPLKELLPLFGQEPLYGNKRSKTHWLVFLKEEGAGKVA